MDRNDYGSPQAEELSPPEEFPVPPEAAEFRPPEPEAEFSSPPEAAEFSQPAPEREFTPPGSGGPSGTDGARRKRRVRRLLYAAAALVLTGLLFRPQLSALIKPDAAASGAQAGVTEPAPDASPLPGPAESPAPDETAPPPAATPEPVGNEPVIETDFFYFSHEHHGRVRIVYPGALHSVRVRVRDTVLDILIYEHDLSDEEIAGGLFELPMLSAGDLYMEHMDEYDAVYSWPDLEMTVDVWYGREDGSGEEELSIVREPDFELGVGFSYMDPEFTWYDAVPADSFYVSPWEDMEEIRYVIDDPSAVTDPLTFSVDVSWNGRQVPADAFEAVTQTNEYTLIDRETGEETPTVSHTRLLVLRRPDWMPEEGTVHVRIVQYLASTGELWVREFDYDYPVRYD